MWHRYHGTFIPIIDRIVPSVSQLMQVRWIDQSSHGLGPQSIYSYGCVLVICWVSCEPVDLSPWQEISLFQETPHPVRLPDTVFSNYTYMDFLKRKER